MPKLKDQKSGAKKRFRVTGTGKILHNHAYKRHGMSKRPRDMLRSTRGTTTLCLCGRENRPKIFALFIGEYDMARVKRGTTAHARHKKLPIKQRVITVAGRMYSVLPFRQLRRLASMRIVIERFAKEPSEDYGYSESMPVLENMD